MKQISLVLTWIIVSLILAADAIGSNDTVLRTLGLSSSWLGLVYLASILLHRFKSKTFLNQTSLMINFGIGTLSLLLGIGLSLAEAVTPANYVYSLTRINPEVLVLYAHYTFVFGLLTLPIQKSKKIISKLVWLIPVWLLMIHFWTFILPFNYAVKFTHEDGPAETIQNLLLIFGVGLSVTQAVILYRQKQLEQFGAYLLIGLFLFFFLMEEISWGQRMFGIQTPTELEQINVQNETNIHNIGILNQIQLYGYLLISGLGLGLAIYQKYKPKSFKPLKTNILTAWLFCLPVLTYNYTLMTGEYMLHSEIVEVLFYAGIVSWIWHQDRRLA